MSMFQEPGFIKKLHSTGGSSSSSDALVKPFTAGEAVGGHRIVKIDSDGFVYYADNTDLNESNDFAFGITTQSAALGDPVSVLLFGYLEEASWAWDLTKKLYLSTVGQITQIVPTAGFILDLGMPLSAVSILFAPKVPIVLV